MNYLFFDIEASEGRSMCSFGYVLCDDRFNVLEKEDILINPEARFCTQAWSQKKREEGKGITLAYPESVFRKSPSFPKQYSRIKAILERDDQLIVGFSHINDVRYLCRACERYHKGFFSYTFFDVQDVYREYGKIKDQISLEKVIQELGVSIDSYVLHKSDDDAEISMLVAKAICEKSGITIDELVQRYSRYIGETKDGQVRYDGVDSERAAVKKARNTCRGVVVAYGNNMRIPPVKGSKLSGKRICAGSPLEKDEWIFALRFIGSLATLGARYVSGYKDADYYVVFDEHEGEERDRLYYLKQNNPQNKVKIVYKDDFYKLMGMTEEEISRFSNPKIERLRTQTLRFTKKILQGVAPELMPEEPKLSR